MDQECGKHESSDESIREFKYISSRANIRMYTDCKWRVKEKELKQIHARSTFGDLPVTPQSVTVLPVSYYQSLLTVQLLMK